MNQPRLEDLAQMGDDDILQLFAALPPEHEDFESALLPFYRYLVREVKREKNTDRKSNLQKLLLEIDSLREWLYGGNAEPFMAAKLFFEFALRVTAHIAPIKFSAKRIKERWSDNRPTRYAKALTWIEIKIINGDIKAGKTHVDLVNEALERDKKNWEPGRKYQPLGKTHLNAEVKNLLRNKLNRPDLIRGGDGKKKD